MKHSIPLLTGSLTLARMLFVPGAADELLREIGDRRPALPTKDLR